MRNLLVFYLCIIAPLVILYWVNKSNLINETWFVFSILFYGMIYRTYTDGKRLADKQLIQKNEIWKMIIPGKRLQYFRELYLK